MKNFFFLILAVFTISALFVQSGNAQIIYRQNFDTVWTTPGTLSPAWTGTVTPADNQWQRQDFTTGWTNALGIYSPVGANSSPFSVRFHSSSALTGSTGDLISPVLNFSTFPGTKKLDFYHINISGSDSLRVYFSTDNGTTWSASLLILGVSSSWTRYTVTLGTSVSATCKIKFTATSDQVASDIGIDQILIFTGNTPLSGTKLIDSLSGDYKSFTEAINVLNLSGVGTGGVTFNVTSGATFTEDPPIITATGTLINPIIFQKTGILANPIIRPTGTTAINDACIAIAGGDYITFDGIDINGAVAVEYGYYIYNASATDGAQYNTIKNSKTILGRTNGNSLGIYQNVLNVPSGATGTNSNNKYYNIAIESVHSGILLNGDPIYPDNLCEIGVTDSTKTTFIGAATAMDIYGYAGPTFGIKAAQQSNCKIFKCEVRNVWSYDYTQPTDGIIFDNDGFGSTANLGTGNRIYNNKVYSISNSASQVSNVSKVSGIRVNLSNNAGNLIQVYNNFIYTISNSATQYYNPTERSAFGVYLQNTGGGLGEIDVYFNNTRMTGNGCSNTCLEVGTVTGPIFNIRNNILANFSSNLSSKFYSFVTPGVTTIGNTGSISNYNDLFNGGNATYGYIGKADTANLKTLANWQTKVTQDANSKNVDPLYISATDLHISYLNRPLYRVGNLIAGFTKDIDYDIRNNPPCIGADEYFINDTTSKAQVPVAQIPSANVPSIDTTLLLSVPVFSFRITDAGTDGKPTKVTNIKIKNNFPVNGAVWSTSIGGVKLNDGTSDIVVTSATIVDSSITFVIPSGNLIVNEASSKTITLYVFLKKVLTDNKTLQFTIPQVGHGFIADGNTGSTFLTDFGAPITSNIQTITVTATQLTLTVPANTYISTNFSATVTAKDGAGNTDVDFAGPITLSRITGTGVLSSVAGLSQSLVTGTFTWTDLQYNLAEIYTIQAAGGGLTILSGNISCYPSSLGATVLVGTDQVIKSLTGANGLFFIINTYGIQTSVTAKITTSLVEDGTNALNQWLDTGVVKKTLTIMPNDTTEKIIQGSVANGLIRINGADRVKFDGRYNDNLKHFRIRNNNAANPTFVLTNSSVHDTITYCNIESSNTGASSGAVFFGSTTGPIGNDSNIVSFCDIRDRSDSARTFANAIQSQGNFLGAVSTFNSSNIIDNCNIYNYAAYGMYLMYGNADWTITNNSFYQTAAKATAGMYGIYINSGSAGVYIVNGNYIGGSAPLCGGTPMTLTATGSFYGMLITVPTTIPSNIQNNIIKNINITYNSTLSYSFIAFNVSGSYNITGNTVGTRVGTGSIAINNNNASGWYNTYGYQLSATGICNIQNNSLGSVILGGTGIGRADVYGVYLSGTPTSNVTISNNIIGSDSTANSIQQTTARLWNFYGIYSLVNTKTLYITNNSISNINNLSTTSFDASSMFGMNIGGTGIPYISNNRIKEINNKAGDTLTAVGSNALTGVYINSTALNDTISLNTIQGLRANNLTAKTVVSGIVVNGLGSTGIVSQNRIFDLTDSSSHVSARLYGINNYIGTNWKYINNQISLNLGSDIQGIHDEFKTGTFSTYYYNSVYLGGTILTGTVNSYGFKRINGATVSILDNIFYNGRTGGTGFHYAISNVKDTLTVGWGATSSNNNLFVVPDTNYTAERGTGLSQTFASWKSLTGGDKNSYSSLSANILAANLFTGTAIGNLNIINTNIVSWYVYDKGVQIPGVANDFAGNVRSIAVATGPTCIGSYEFSINPLINIPPSSSMIPVPNTNSSFVLNGRTLANITWGATLNKILNGSGKKNNNSNSDFPTITNLYYYSGCLPPDTTGVSQIGRSFWKVNTNSNPLSNVSLTINYTDQELGNIVNPVANVILSKYDSATHAWTSFLRGTTGNGVSIVDTIAKTITVNGISGINNSIWALTSTAAPTLRLSVDLTLLIEGLYFNGGKPGYMVKDTVSVILKDSSKTWITVDSAAVALDSLGHGTFNTVNASLGGNYYLRIRHRNSMETWSGLGNNSFSPSTGKLTFDFTTAQNKAYGSNQILKNGKWCLYSGEVVQDGFIDGSDMALVDNAAFVGTFGWVLTDLNGDLFVDGSDLAVCDNNAFNGILVSRPLTFPGGLLNKISGINYRQMISDKLNTGNYKPLNDKSQVSNPLIKGDGPNANEFTLRISNLVQAGPDSVTFKIYLKNTSTSQVEFASGQYYFDFNSAALNGGTGTLRILASDLSATNQAPRNPQVKTSPNGQLWLQVNAVPGAGLGKIILSGDSIMVAYSSLKTTAGVMAATNLNMIWRNSTSGIPYTKIFEYIGNVNTDVTSNGLLINPPDVTLPIELSSFTSIVSKRDVKLIWSTNMEMNNAGFEIQKSIPENGSTDSKKWDKVTFVSSKGNTGVHQDYSFEEKNLQSGKYSYRLKQIDINGNFKYFYLSNDVVVGVPTQFDLHQNYPNPFNPTTKIDFELPKDSKVTLKIYDITGREISTLINEMKSAGFYTVELNAGNFASGIYIYQIIADNGKDKFVKNKKMMVIK